MRCTFDQLSARCALLVRRVRLPQLELCEDDLESRLKRNVSISMTDIFAILRDVLLGLNVLHQNNLVHLDIKVGLESNMCFAIQSVGVCVLTL